MLGDRFEGGGKQGEEKGGKIGMIQEEIPGYE